jgi:DNA transposition AAA+ family ATPase
MQNTHPWKLTETELATRTAHCPPEQIQLLTWAFHHAADRNLSIADFCSAAKINSSTLTKFLGGTYTDPRRPGLAYDLPSHVVSALQAYQAALIASVPTSVGFVATDTCRKVWFNCDLALESRSPLFMIGASQIGKTTALQKRRDAHPDTHVLVTCTSGMAAKGLAVALAEEMGLPSGGSLATLTRRIRKAANRNKLLIFDDFHVLSLSATPRTFLSAMEFLRAIYDADNCGMLFSTTDIDYARIDKECRSSLHQLIRRGPPPPHLGMAPLQKDVRSIIEAHGLRWPAKSLLVGNHSPWKIIAALAIQNGLKGVCERLRYALKLSAKDGVPVTWNHYILADGKLNHNATAPANDWI